MPQSVVIAIPPTVGFGELARVAREVATIRGMRYSEGTQAHDASCDVRVFRHDRRDHLFITEMLPREEVATAFAEDYADRPDVDAPFRAQAGTLLYVSVTFAELDTVRDFVFRLFRWLVAENAEAWMDTDFGEVLAARDVVRHLEEDPGWDWRLKQQ